ncbi:MFS transporter [Verrucosispora sp. WMMD703]|uniref:MFS transporter n=1 Tax=unclassified Micromonospora TaxID=2617518 RepID=UPI00249B848A|nr:MFS transporter [Verrucosispora sp. WMMD1129]WFE43095.1 MFS transporter [Verrucosispora sp. WMMD1129]
MVASGGRAKMPGAYRVWLGGSALSLVGVQAMAFAMAWSAAGQGARFAALVPTAIVLPRVLLLLVGGAVADRFGVWLVLLASNAAMVVVTVALAAVAWSPLDLRLPLLLTALAIGTVDAFQLPSSGSMPRRLVPPGVLARAMSARQLVGQFALFSGPPLGGVLLGMTGLAGAALTNTATFLAMLAVLLVVRPAAEQPQDAGPDCEGPPDAGSDGGRPPNTGRGHRPPGAGVAHRRSPVSAGLDGLRLAWSVPVLRLALLVTGVAAGFLLPVGTLLVPLLARQRDWSASATGAVVAAMALGTAAIALGVLLRGGSSRPAAVAAVGLLVAAAGVVALAVARAPLPAVLAGVLVGAGAGCFATHVGPLVLAATPLTHLARVQSVLVLAQSLPLLVTANAFGLVVEIVDVPAVLFGCAGVLAVTGLAALATPTLRGSSSPATVRHSNI